MKIITFFKLLIKNITMAKLISVSMTIIFVASLKYSLSSNLTFNYEDLLPNILLGHIG